MTRPDRPVPVQVGDVTYRVRHSESAEAFADRVGTQLDAHFARFAPAIAAINAGFAATRRTMTANPSPDRGGKRTR